MVSSSYPLREKVVWFRLKPICDTVTDNQLLLLSDYYGELHRASRFKSGDHIQSLLYLVCFTLTGPLTV